VPGKALFTAASLVGSSVSISAVDVLHNHKQNAPIKIVIDCTLIILFSFLFSLLSVAKDIANYSFSLTTVKKKVGVLGVQVATVLIDSTQASRGLFYLNC
jgi:hypothetical protein